MEIVRRCKPSRLYLLCCALIALGALGFTSLALAQEASDLMIERGVKKIPPAVRATHIQTTGNQSLGAPSNDECAGAIVIPDGATNTGDYPVCSDLTFDVGSATPDCASGPGADPATCLPLPSYIANTIWYKWSPQTSAYYKILACHGDDCGPGTTLTTGTDPSTGGDGALALFSADSCGGPFTLVGCDDDGCGGGNTSKINLVYLPAGDYYIMAGNWTNGASCNSTNGTVVQYQIRIEYAAPPANDTCDTAEVLQLDIPVPGGMNGLTNSDYEVPIACYTTADQIPSTQIPSEGPGRDLCYSFTAPHDGNYSFYAKHYNAGPSTSSPGPDMVLYVQNGPTPPAAGMIDDCLNAAGRALPVAPSTTNGNNVLFGNSEETFCVPMVAGQTVYPIVDETQPSLTSDTTFWIEANECTFEEEYNGTPEAAEDPAGDGSLPPNSALAACPVTGQIFSTTFGQDIDFWTLGQQPEGSRLFAMVDCDGANPREDGASSTNLDMRVTTATDTLEFDDQDLSTPNGTLCPDVAGTPLPGDTNLYLRINNVSATTSTEPYRIHAIVRGPIEDAIPEPSPEPNDNRLMFAPGSDYVHGTHDTSVDYDYYAFCAKKGDYIMVNVDTDPTKDATPAAEVIGLFDSALSAVPVPGFFYGVGNASVPAPNPGPGLTAVTPRYSGDGLVWRAAYTGYYISLLVALGPPYVGDYLYQQSLNCAAPDADMGIEKTGPTDATAGSNVTYSITATNHGPNLALLAEWIDETPPGTTFVSISIPDGWDCVTPDPGTAGFIDCFALDVCYEGSGKFDVTINVPACSGTGALVNTAYMFSSSTDSNSTNDESTWTLLVTDPGTCDDGDFCTAGDHCEDGACVSTGPTDCSDGNDCTDDSCDSESGCINTPNDENSCSDNNACTTVDVCSGGVCVGSDPPNCNDGNNNTTDSCDPSVGCVNECNGSNYFHGMGFYKRLCRGPHPSGEFLSQVDVECVNDHCPFQGVLSVADICDRLSPDPQNDKCEQAEAQFMTLLLNTCRCGLGHHQPIAASCGPDTTVEQAIAGAEAHLCPPDRTHQDCVVAHDCETEPINNGAALWANSLHVTRDGSTVTLAWTAPYGSPDGLTGATPHWYRIFARSISEAPMVQIGQVNGNTTAFQHFNASGNQQYEVIAIW